MYGCVLIKVLISILYVFLSGVKSLTKAVLKTKNVFFQYPAAPMPQLIDVSIQCSLASRVAVVGVNGAG